MGSVASGLNKVVTIPSGTPAGTYYVWVVADNGSVLTQSNYANDYAHSVALTVTAAQSDVLPQNISLSSSTVAAGGTLTVTFDIRNQGGGDAVATTTRLRLNQSTTTTSPSDTSLGDVSTPAIAAGNVASGLNKLVTIPSGTPAGTYYVWVVADNGSVLNQSNVANDYAHSSALTVTVTAAQSDILPQNISLSSSTVTAGGTLTVTFDIRNQGSGDAIATTTRLRLNQSSTTTSPSDTSLGDVSTAKDEADFFISVAGNYIGPGYLPPALDIEDPDDELPNHPVSALGKTVLSQWIRDWCAEVVAVKHVKPMIYTTPSFTRMPLDSDLAQYPLWIAYYESLPDVNPQTDGAAPFGPWNYSWTFLQYSVQGHTLDGAVQYPPEDLNVFNGDLTALNNYVAGGGGSGGSAPVISNPKLTGTTFTLSVPTQVGFNYTLEYKNSFGDANWTTVQTIGGTGGTITLTDTGATGLSRLYHVRVQ